MFRENKKCVGKSLQPAQPVCHLPAKQSIVLNCEAEVPSNAEECLQSEINPLPEMTEMKLFPQAVVSCQMNQHESEAKKGRIQYSRDFLLKLSSVSLSQKKPEFLPDYPIVLEKPEKSIPFLDRCKK